MAINIDTKVTVLLNRLKNVDDIPRKLPIEGFIKSIAEKLLPYSVFVDKWPDYRIIIAKPKDDQIQKLPVYRLGVYTRDTNTLANMLCQPGFLPKSVTIRIFGMPVELIPAVEKTAKYLNSNVKFIQQSDPRFFTHLDKMRSEDDAEELRKSLAEEFYISSLDPEKYGEYITLHWRYWQDFYENETEAIEVTKYYIKSGPAIGVFTKKDNKLTSWMISNIDRSNMMGHTLPEYRRQNLLMFGMQEMTRKRFEMGDIFWGYVAKSNPAVSASLLKWGANVDFSLKCVHCVLRPKNKYNSKL